MHITLDEGISLLENWKSTETVLQIYFSRPGAGRRELQAKIRTLRGSVVELDSSSDPAEVDLTGAELNGDMRTPLHSTHGAYLVCEYRNGDRWSFYAPRVSQTTGAQA